MTTTLAHAANAAQTISRDRNPGLDLTIIERRHLREAHLTLRPLPGEQPAAMIGRLGGALQETGATPVRFEVFGALSARQATLETLETTLGPIAWPVIWKEEASTDPGGVSGLHVLAIAGAGVETIDLDGRIVGCCFNDGWARHCVLGGLGPEDVSAPVRVQTRKTHEQLAGALRAAGMAMSHVVRTWFLLDDIRSSYGVFNAARTEFYQRHKLLNGLVPASSVVGARLPAGAALTAGAWAIQPANGSLMVQAVPSPLQCPAQNYDACFSRAVEITTPCHRRLLVSGTAGLGPDGRTSAVGDIQGQVDLALRAMGAILASRRLSLFDVTRATAYFKRAADMRVFTDWCVTHDALFLPALMIQSDLCRKDLLFELELDAIASTARQSHGTPPASGHAPMDDKRAFVPVPGKKRTCKGSPETLRRPVTRVADGGRR